MTGINQKVMTTDQDGLPLPTNLNDWKGVNRKVTAMWPDSTIAFYQQNLRMRVKGELQRRNGMAQGNIAKQATAVLGILPVSAPQGSGTIVIPSNGTVVGFPTTPIMAFTEGGGVPPIITNPVSAYSLVMNTLSHTQVAQMGEITTSDAAIADILFPIPPQTYNWTWSVFSDPSGIFAGYVTPFFGTDSFTNAPSVTIITDQIVGVLIMQLTCTFLSEPTQPSLSATWTLHQT